MTRVLKLQLNRRLTTFGVPLIVLCIVVAIGVIVTAAVYRFAPSETDVQMYGAITNSMLPVAFVMGVQSVAMIYPVARALGSGRRTFVAGTALYLFVAAAYITLLAVVFLGIERLTNHWFVQAYVLDMDFLVGDGWLKMIVLCLVFALAAESLGVLIGTIWLRWSTPGLWVFSLSLAVVLAAIAWVVAPRFFDVLPYITFPVVTLSMLVLTLVLFASSAACMRNVSIRAV